MNTNLPFSFTNDIRCGLSIILSSTFNAKETKIEIENITSRTSLKKKTQEKKHKKKQQVTSANLEVQHM